MGQLTESAVKEVTADGQTYSVAAARLRKRVAEWPWNPRQHGQRLGLSGRRIRALWCPGDQVGSHGPASLRSQRSIWPRLTGPRGAHGAGRSPEAASAR
jgi:hypothetical protein